MSKKIYYIVAFLFGLSLILFLIIKSNSEVVKVIFLDVGQGDAILINKGSSQIVIDGGRSSKMLLEKLGRYIPFWDKKIEAVISTHPDYDHIGGLIGLLDNYQIEAIIEPDIQGTSKAYKKWEKYIASKEIQKLKARNGVKLTLGKDKIMKILYPFGWETEFSSINQASVIAKLNLGSESFIFTGDATKKSELKILNLDDDIKANYLKIAHHGSKSSTGEGFLSKVNPEGAIISVGENNYGHPHKEILNKLKKQKIKILRTDKNGDVVFRCKKECSLLSY